MFIVSLYQMFGTDTLRHRDTARKVAESLPKTDQAIIDFANIDFASRSFLHELLSDLGDRNVVFKNTNNEVKQMMEIVKKGAFVVC
jgi:hypothetical protein